MPDQRLQQDPSSSTSGSNIIYYSDTPAEPNHGGRNATGPSIIYYNDTPAKPNHGGGNVAQTDAQPQAQADRTTLDKTTIPATVEQEAQKPSIGHRADEPVEAKVARDGRATNITQGQTHQPSDATLVPSRPRAAQNPPRLLEGNAALAQSMSSTGTAFCWNYSNEDEAPQSLAPTVTEPQSLETETQSLGSPGQDTPPAVVEHYLTHQYVPSQSYAARVEPIVIDTADGSIVCTCARQGQGRGLMGSRYANPNEVSITMERNFIHHCPVHPRADIYNQETPSTARHP